MGEIISSHIGDVGSLSTEPTSKCHKVKVLKGYVTAICMRTKATVVEVRRPFCNPKKAKKPAAMDSWFGRVTPHQHGTASR